MDSKGTSAAGDFHEILHRVQTLPLLRQDEKGTAQGGKGVEQDGGQFMILTDGEILDYMVQGKLKIAPIEQIQIQPASVDIRLGDTFCVIDDSARNIISLQDEIHYKTIKNNSYVLLPGQFVLATTVENFALPNNLTAFVEGRSSLGRLGLFIQNAGWVDPGFEGEITLELYNASRHAIELCHGCRIGQLVFAKSEKDAIKPYRGKYQGQSGATGSRIYKDFGGV